MPLTARRGQTLHPGDEVRQTESSSSSSSQERQVRGKWRPPLMVMMKAEAGRKVEPSARRLPIHITGGCTRCGIPSGEFSRNPRRPRPACRRRCSCWRLRGRAGEETGRDEGESGSVGEDEFGFHMEMQGLLIVCFDFVWVSDRPASPDTPPPALFSPAAGVPRIVSPCAQAVEENNYAVSIAPPVALSASPYLSTHDSIRVRDTLRSHARPPRRR